MNTLKRNLKQFRRIQILSNLSKQAFYLFKFWIFICNKNDEEGLNKDQHEVKKAIFKSKSNLPNTRVYADSKKVNPYEAQLIIYTAEKYIMNKYPYLVDINLK